ncbi:hypothetical protein IKF27_03235 [Candidatus Saccharibacteria bacterium]|nr:hypothetical protein [Candidatus Saccharibacteria bacterium]
MSKKVGYIIAVAGLAALGFSLPLLNTTGVRADEARPTENLIATTTGLAQKMDETVYVFLNTDGTVKKTISSDWSKNDLGADVYTKTEGKVSTPVTMKISYFLDDKAVSAEEIRGRSGHIKIRYDFTNNERVNGMFVPVAVLSGAVLPNEVFSNVKLTNAKLINDGTRMMVAGLALPGMKENLGVNIDIPEYFEIEADAKEFKMEMTATVATSKIFADLDLTALNSVDALSSALQTLSDSMLQLLDGSVKLRDGLATLNSKTSILADGVSQLRAGSLKLVDGAKALSNGIVDAATGAQTIADGLAQAYDGAKDSPAEMAKAYEGAKAVDAGVNELLAKLNGGFAQLNANDNNTKMIDGATQLLNGTLDVLKAQGLTNINKDNFEEVLKGAIASATAAGLNDKVQELSTALAQLSIYSGTIKYVSGVNQIAAGVSDSNPDIAKLKVGTSQLADGLKDASGKISKLSGGLAELSAGANQLSAGLEAAKDGSSTLHYGLMSLDAGISNLESNVPALTSGVSQLAEGSKALSDGLLQFNDEGVQRLVSLYNGNVKALVSKIQTMVNLAKSANKIKYIYRTDEI